MTDHDPLFAVIDWIIAVIFVGLGILSYKKTSLAMILGLSVYGLLIILNFLADPSSLFGGIIWKVVIIAALVTGIRTALAEEKKKPRKIDEDILDQY